MDLRRISALARIIDPRYPSNRFVLFAGAVGAAIAVAYQFSVGGVEPWTSGLRVGLGVFLAWAIGRELDPDHPVSAAIAAIIGGAAAWLAPPELGAAAGFLVAVRIVARTTGLSAHPWELAALVGFVGYLAATPSGWPAAIILVVALWIDGGHAHEPHAPSRIAAVIAGVVSIIVVVLAFPTELDVGRGWGGNLVYLIGAVAVWPAVRCLESPVSVGDHDKAPLSRQRLAQARITAAFGIGLAGVLTTLHPAAYGPAWAAMVAIAAVAVSERSFWHRRRTSASRSA